MPHWLHRKRSTYEFCDFGVGQQLRENDNIPEVELVTDPKCSFFVFDRPLLVKFDIDGHENVHCMGIDVLILRITEASLLGCSLYSQRRLFSSILKWVSLVSWRSLG